MSIKVLKRCGPLITAAYPDFKKIVATPPEWNARSSQVAPTHLPLAIPLHFITPGENSLSHPFG